MFQSSARPRAGCNVASRLMTASPPWFQSSARPRAGCNIRSRFTAGIQKRFQSSARPRAGCNPGAAVAVLRDLVSILSPPEGRLQRRPSPATSPASPCFNPQPARGQAATPVRQDWQDRAGGFNPQPARGQAATQGVYSLAAHGLKFQSSARPRAGCNTSRRFPIFRMLLFQSSARPRAGCNTADLTLAQREFEFQSSARPRAGCNVCGGEHDRPDDVFQSSARPRAGCNDGGRVETVPRLEFQSSARPRAGCNGACRSRRRRHRVSILSPPEGRLQRRSRIT